jgi:hypothetical protein
MIDFIKRTLKRLFSRRKRSKRQTKRINKRTKAKTQKRKNAKVNTQTVSSAFDARRTETPKSVRYDPAEGSVKTETGTKPKSSRPRASDEDSLKTLGRGQEAERHPIKKMYFEMAAKHLIGTVPDETKLVNAVNKSKC